MSRWTELKIPAWITTDHKAESSAVPLAAPINLEVKGASAEFANKIKSMTEELPQGVIQLLKSVGTHVLIAGEPTDVNINAGLTNARGWQGKGFDEIEGWYDSEKNSVNIFEYIWQFGARTANSRTEEVYSHELGHAFDFALGKFSSTDEFQEAYRKDVSKLSDAARATERYFLQSGQGGPEEIMAQAFAQTTGHLSGQGNSDLLHDFPEVLNVVRDRLKKLGSDMNDPEQCAHLIQKVKEMHTTMPAINCTCCRKRNF